jgi:hypothetical protein
VSVVIDLGDHLAEVQAFAKLAADFVDNRSALRLEDLVRSLQAGIAASAPKWTWETPQPIEFGPSKRYDGPDREMAEAWAKLEFCCSFERPETVDRKAGDKAWRIDSTAVHVTMTRGDGHEMTCHFDYKNKNQWGPQLHAQLAEGDHKFPIPRLPSAVFLPTDCADLVLSELMPEAWDKHQRRHSNEVAMLRRAQEHRSISLLSDINRQWNEDAGATRVSMLQSYTTRLKGFPNHRNQTPTRNWP